MRRTLTFTAVAAGEVVVSGAALWALAGHGDARFEPLLVPTDPPDRRNGAPRPVHLMAATARAPGRGLAQRTLEGVVAALAAWTIIETLVFSGSLMVWLTFGAAAAMVAIAVAGLTTSSPPSGSCTPSEDVRMPDRHVEALS